MRQKGQVILILILVMTVVLAIGLSIVQKSLTDVSTASKVEQSSRAFSAAEAGIEKALNSSVNSSCTNCQTFTDNSAAIKQITDSDLLPATSAASTRQAPLEFPSLAKEDIAQVWLADLDSTANPPALHYKQTTLDVYWGDPSATADKAALELTLVYWDGTTYSSKKWYLDQIIRNPDNGFEQVNCSGQCKKTLSGLPSGLMLLRARLLYNSFSQPFAVQAMGICGNDCSIPSQAKKITSTGISGETQRSVQLFQLYKVAPPYFDYAIFSAGEISK